MHHALPPFERCSLGIVRCQEAVDRFPDLMWRGKTRAAQSLARQDAKPDLDLIEPTGMGRCVVPVHIGVASPPAISLRLMTAQVVQHDVNLLLGVIGHHFVHEVQELPTPPTVDIFTAESGPSAALREALENPKVAKRVGRDTPTVPPLQADPVARQRSPDLARRHIAQGSGDQSRVKYASPVTAGREFDVSLVPFHSRGGQLAGIACIFALSASNAIACIVALMPQREPR